MTEPSEEKVPKKRRKGKRGIVLAGPTQDYLMGKPPLPKKGLEVQEGEESLEEPGTEEEEEGESDEEEAQDDS